MKAILFLIIPSLLIHTGSLQAACTGKTYYVAPIGLDKNLGTSDKPFNTINKAASLAKPGDTVIVKKGEYLEAVKISRAGTKDCPIIFQSEVKEAAVFKNSPKNGILLVPTSKSVVIDGMG